MLLPFFQQGQVEAGCDEAGRGCLAGPVVAAAVILPPDFKNELLNDSKKLSESKRNKLRTIIEDQALAWAVSFVNHEEIDEVNILNASFIAMHRSIDQLSTKPTSLLIDGNRFNGYQNIPHHCIIKGDGKYLSIAAASILAKTHRDEYMVNMDKEYPRYDWKRNKGYPTKKHRAAIAKIGVSPIHRKSFKLLTEQMNISFK